MHGQSGCRGRSYPHGDGRPGYLRAAKALRTLGDLCSERRQRLQILTVTGVPPRSKVCLWTLALNRVLVCRLEWLTL